MHLTVWCLLVVLLLKSAEVGSYNQESQRFFEPAYTDPRSLQNDLRKNVRLFLTPNQVEALERQGFVLRREEPKPKQQYSDKNVQREHVEEDYERYAVKQKEPEITEVQKKPKEILQLEEIFRVLNRQIEEDAKQTHVRDRGQVPHTENGEEEEQEEGDDEENYEQVKSHVKPTEEQKYGSEEDEQSDNFQRILARFGVLQRYIAPPLLRKQYQQQINTIPPNQLVRYQGVSKDFEARREENIRQNENILEDRHKKIIVVDDPQEQNYNGQKEHYLQDHYTPLSILSDNKNVAHSVPEHRDKLLQNNVQIHREFQHINQSPRYDNQKHVIGIERSREYLEPRHTLTRAEVIAKLRPFVSEEQIDTENIQIDNNRDLLSARVNYFPNPVVRTPQKYLPLHITRPIPVPVLKRSRIDLKSPVIFDSENQGSVATPKRVYVSKNNAYSVQIDPVEINKQLVPSHKHKQQTIIRHLWEH